VHLSREPGDSTRSKWATLPVPQDKRHRSPVTSPGCHFDGMAVGLARREVSRRATYNGGLSLYMGTFDLESLTESAELELAMVFVLGRLVRPYHGFR
jgi:hypothetical protein